MLIKSQFVQKWRVYHSMDQTYLKNPNHLFYDNGVEVDPEEYNFETRSEAVKEAKRQYGLRGLGDLYFQSEGFYILESDQ
tara:strand:+ start:2651 stop:2890 length:240 start_codon:yes stop_codon:yes gene_type:complete